jgi:hypothetical protein
MDGFQGVDILDFDPGVLPIFPSLGGFLQARDGRSGNEGLIEHRIEALQTLVITKLVAGFDDECVDSLRLIIEDAAAGRRGPLKFLVLDFAHHMERDSEGGTDFNRLVNDVAQLILRSPIVSVACVRAHLAGADLELALACNLMIAEAGRRFSFAADPTVSLATYGFLSQKIGFVRAERLMETGDSVNAEQMRDLLLVKAMLEEGAGFGEVEQFLARSLRRHNSAYAIYRAQRIASPCFLEDVDKAKIA